MNTVAALIKYLRTYQRYIGRRIYIVFVLSILVALTEGFGIALLLPLIRATQGGGEVDGTVQEYLYAFLDAVGIGDSVVGILIFIGVVFVGKGLLKFAQGGYKSYLQAQLLRELKIGLFDEYGTMDYRYYIQRSTGHFINVINEQIRGFYFSFDFFAKFLSQIISALSYFAIAFVVAWRFALSAVVVGGVLLFLFKYLNQYVRELGRRASKEMSHLNKLLVQALRAFKYIVATGQVDQLRGGVVDSVHRLTGYKMRAKVARAFTGAIKEPLSVLFIVSVIAVQVAVFEAAVAPLFVALLLFHRGIQTTISVQGSWQSVMNKVGPLEMVVDEFDTLQKYREEDGTVELGALQDGIELRNVHYAYDEDEGDVLHNFNISIPANTTVALVGESGAGKSTLVDLLTLMLRPRKGEVVIDGVPGSEVALDSWRDQIGYVSQETVVFDDTVANNISLWAGENGYPGAVQERIEDAARRAHAHHFIEELPDGYQTVVGDRGVRLSGGQKQRLFVARELFKQPNLLLLDEATSDLDTASEQHIQDSVDALQGEVTVVIIAHRLSTVKNADRVYVLDDGRVVEEGSYHELRMREDGQFREMVEMQRL
jgi:ABC-type multidrug transport system fused ATPase/permease subunit